MYSTGICKQYVGDWYTVIQYCCCKFLVATAYGDGYFPSTTGGNIVMNKVGCRGSETSLVTCSYTDNTYGCTQANNAGVRCYKPGNIF